MQLKILLEQLTYTAEKGVLNKQITGVVYDSGEVIFGCLFVCIKGQRDDGHNYMAEVIAKGAAALVVEQDVELPFAIAADKGQDVTIIRVKNTRIALALISAAWFDYPAKKLKTIGITGTKGKTTTTYFVKAILEQAGYKVGLLGTIEVIIGDTHIQTNNTTPESYLLQEYLYKMVEAGCDAAVMEVSSQGLKLHRTRGIEFDYGVFTNLETDHIGKGEHKDFAEYMACKSLLFKQCRIGIANGDDAYFKAVTKDHSCTLETFGLKDGNDLQAFDLQRVKASGELGITFQTTGTLSMELRVPSPGIFSVYNALAAMAICRHFKVTQAHIERALNRTKVKGRIEFVKVSDTFTLLIDYAHNAMSLESLLKSLREYKPHRLVCLFGCGGNRSKLRRLEMGEVSGRLADLTVITSDNPRYEEPWDIIEDIKKGIRKTNGAYVAICDRKEAIAYAINNSGPGDIVVLAGKGHEDYQEIKGVKYPMDERTLIADILSVR